MQTIPSRMPLSRTAPCTSSVMSVTVSPPEVRSCVSRWKTFTGAYSGERRQGINRRSETLKRTCARERTELRQQLRHQSAATAPDGVVVAAADDRTEAVELWLERPAAARRQ